MKPELGCCYYPEHWPQEIWADDARRMVENGLSWVRIGEFAWSRIEPEEGKFCWDWLDDAISILANAGLKIVLGTPTATPPHWMLLKHGDMLAHDAQGLPRKFGSRRHYCFSHLGYRSEAKRIADILARRYGDNKAIVAWQIDNEYGCHETTLSYSPAARQGFCDWLAQKYQSPDALNRAWGNIFWSMEYGEFDDVDLPNLTVTEANPAHLLDFHRYTSDQVVAFNRVQADAIRAFSQAPLIHNYMGRIVDFDHFKVGADLDIASWDSYPLGFLEDRLDCDDAFKAKFMRQGHPDFQAFHHDLYRRVGKGRWWVMEQQPGPVNWAPWNPAPKADMVKVWTWEAIAHGAEVVSYFRWRQAPFAQEQMHSGLLRCDDCDAPAMAQVRDVYDELQTLDAIEQKEADIAIVFDYESAWAWNIQPQGQDFDYFSLCFDFYSGLRSMGQSIDFIPSTATSFGNHKLVVIAGLFALNDNLKTALKNFEGAVLIGPRTGSKTADFAIPVPLPPNIPELDVKVTLVESLAPRAPIQLAGVEGKFQRWFEHLETSETVILKTEDAQPALVQSAKTYYLAGWPDEDGLVSILTTVLEASQIDFQHLGEGLRLRDTKTHRFWIDYENGQISIECKNENTPN